ncbi:sulfatase-like hydrolase/transferase, partial [Anaerosinus sp.]|uniref:sulfatase-like hydrolase/transferase n=1 Tax=Selenobaculum sp. TaxID=3074374 RepID=UPI003AB3F54C
KGYPKEYNVFNESDIESNFDTKRKLTIAEYDNAVLYNDFIVNEIIKRFEGKETLIIYISDHGEEVYDNRDYVGHTEDNGSKYMIEIPMIVWGSKNFVERYPEKLQSIKMAIKHPYMTDDIIHSILDLLEIKTIDYDSSRSIFSPDFNEKRQRIYHGQDYDNELKNF